MGRAGVDSRIEQADDGMFDASLGVQGEGGEADHPGMTWAKAGGLDVNDDPALPRLGGWSAPGVAHPVRMARTPDSARYIAPCRALHLRSA
ncbi:hypothetical protein MANY_35150 [Mycolicibacterium anyangense]|uniref:Uncharacterized protein n=1 Tax=Mycolicibacterium anyangense TaxID=1431246 RepID=A0A6N4WCC0_9MYCO|nr:hypothetical protein MANY_35150 [Mycolicibacterium anyangense]